MRMCGEEGAGGAVALVYLKGLSPRPSTHSCNPGAAMKGRIWTKAKTLTTELFESENVIMFFSRLGFRPRLSNHLVAGLGANGIKRDSRVTSTGYVVSDATSGRGHETKEGVLSAKPTAWAGHQDPRASPRPHLQGIQSMEEAGNGIN